MPNPTMKKHGQTSKHISTAHNAYSVTNFAQPNRPALPATSPSTPNMKANHPQNIAKLSSISPPPLQPTANCSLLWPLPSPISTTTFKNSTKRPTAVSTTVPPSTQLSSLSISSSVSDLQQQLADLKRENEQLRNKHNRRPRTHQDNGNYCWTHGYHVGNKHNSATCQNKAPGHQDNATRENTMGGSQANKPINT